MGKRKLIIADGTEEFRMALARKLEAEYEIRLCQEGEQTLDMLASFRPDVLVLDLTMPGLDGITLLQQAAESGLLPVVLATTRFLNDYVLDSVSRLGVGYLMVKPCNISATVSRLGDLTQHLRPPGDRNSPAALWGYPGKEAHWRFLFWDPGGLRREDADAESDLPDGKRWR